MYFLFPIVAAAALAAPQAALAFEFTIIPTSMSEQFQSGNFEWADIATFGLHLLQLMLTLAGSIAVIMLMVAGFQYMAAGLMGDESGQGKETILYTLVGFAITALSWLAVDIVIAFLQGGG